MKYNEHWNLKDKHAFLSPSSYSWIRYTDEHLMERFATSQAAKLGSALHQLAHDCIKLRQRLEGNKTTMARYVRDVLGDRMTPEQILYYSENCFGTADAIGFRRESKDSERFTLRIYDLKTGVSPAKVDQLLIYCALFCLEYKFKPFDIDYDLRIYQSNDIAYYEVDPKDIVDIMDKIVAFDKMIEDMKAAEYA